jgi:hypothetical protein
VIGLVLAVLLATGAFMLRPGPDRITRESFRHISEGMSRTEVCALLGPAGDYRTSLTEKPPFWWLMDDGGSAFGIPYDTPTPLETLEWQGDQGDISVLLCPNGVATKSFFVTRKVEQGPFENLFWRVKRQWRKWFPKR